MKSVKKILFFGRAVIVKNIRLMHRLAEVNLAFFYYADFLKGENYIC